MNTTFPGPTKNTKLKVDIKKIVLLKDPAQTELLLGRLAKRIEAHPEDTAWSELMKEDVREYVFKHLSAPATDVLRVLVGSKSKGKQQLADELAEAEALYRCVHAGSPLTLMRLIHRCVCALRAQHFSIGVCDRL